MLRRIKYPRGKVFHYAKDDPKRYQGIITLCGRYLTLGKVNQYLGDLSKKDWRYCTNCLRAKSKVDAK